MISNNKHRTPKLRFPGFEGEWAYVNGDVLFESISNKNHNSDLPILALTQDQGAVPRELINYKIQVSEKSVENYKVVDIDDFIISLRSFQGGIEYSKYKGLCSPAYIVLRKKNKNVVSDFYRHYFKSFKYIQDLNKNLEGIRDGKMISFKQFSEIQIPFPSPIEQQKIADCLSSLDEEIAAEAQKADALKTHKKGLMQQLFPAISNEQLAMSNCVPELRFPGFTGEWEVKKLGEIADLNPKTTFLPEKFIYIDLESVESGVLKKSNQVERDSAPSRAQRLLKDGDILFQMVRPYQRNNFHFFKKDNQEYVASTGYAQIRYNICSKFLYQYLHNDTFVSNVVAKCVGGNYPAINSSDLSEQPVLIPPTLAEQQKIADCLSELDEMISAQQQKVEALKEHKKGLMQKLFPKID